MTRILLAIGCDAYDHLNPLTGAVFDAKRVSDLLTDEAFGDYEAERSQILLSPTKEEVLKALSETLSVPDLETFTLYFAGHGGAEKGTFYLGLSEAQSGKLWETGLSLAQVFTMIAGAGPAHANIIIDACESAGLVADLNVITKTDVMGNAGTPAITLLAMSAANKGAGESSDGGFGTNALLDCINGTAFVQDSNSALDLTEICKVVCDRIKAVSAQEPRWFVLNHNQRAAFCRNPHYQASAATAFAKWEPRAFLDNLEPLLSSHASQPKEILTDVERLVGGLVERAKGSRDRFKEVEVLATKIVAVLGYVESSRELQSYVVANSLALAGRICELLLELAAEMEAEKYALLSTRGGLADFFYLPIRITKLLGWFGAAHYIYRQIKREDRFPKDKFSHVLRLMIDNYAGSIVAISDKQAPDVALALSAISDLGLREEGESILGMLFSSVCDSHGKVADNHLAPEDVLQFVLSRHRDDFSGSPMVLARPSELIAVLLRSSTLFDLAVVFDEALEDLDHTAINAYVAEDYARFSDRYISSGNNLGFRIGHDIWTVGDLMHHWPQPLPRPSMPVAFGAIWSSLLFPDRVPWFVFPEPIV